MNEKRVKELKRYQKMLYVIDMINGFVNEGVLHDKHIQGTIPEQIRLIEKMQQEKEGISFIRDCHSKNCMEFQTFPEHCLEGTRESMLVPELQPYEKDNFVYLKNSTSAMFAPHMIEHLNQMENLKEVIATGCCTDICNLNFLIPLKNYFHQQNRDVTIFAVKNAMDTYHIPGIHDREEYTNMAYKLMEQSGIVLVEDMNELLKREEEKGFTKKKERK